MEKKTTRPMTPFDELVTSPQLQAMKLLLPYAPVSQQRLLAAFIKFLELRQTFLLFGRLRRGLGAQLFQEEAPASPQALLNSMKHYLGPQESGMLEMLMNMKDIMDMAEMMNSSSEDSGSSFDPADLMMGMLTPEQQEMFSTYNAMFSQAADNARKGDDSSERMDEQPGAQEYRPGEAGADQMAAAQTQGKSGRDLAPVMLALITNASRQGIRFSPDEVTLILNILKEGKTKEEQAQIDKTIRMTSSIFQKHMS